MRICVFTHSLDKQTGTGEFAHNLITEIESLLPGSEFTLLSGEDVLRPSYFSIIKNWSKIRRSVRECDIIHALDCYPYGAIAALANWHIDKPLLITAIGTGSLQLFERRGLKAMVFRWAYARAMGVTAISRYVAREIERYLPGMNVQVINPGIDYEYWSREESNYIDTQMESLAPYVLSVGELKKRKGYEKNLPVVSEVMKTVPDLNYVIVANIYRNKKYKAELKREIEALGIEGKVVFLSSLSREALRSVYQHALIYLTLPQKIGGDVEGFGLSILQAAAGGLPSVVGRGSGAEDAVLDSRSGFLVSSDNQLEVVERVKELLKDNDLQRKLSAGAKEFARGMTWREFANLYSALYKELNK